MNLKDHMTKLGDPKEHADRKRAAEVAHAAGIASKIKAGWTVTGVRLVEDPRKGDIGQALTLFDEEQEALLATLSDILANRRKMLGG